MLLDKIVGQDEAISYLKRLLRREDIPPLIFYGKNGIGKRKAALAFAGSLNCNDYGCDECPSCKHLSLNIHPDIKEIKDDNGYIKIDTIRELVSEGSFRETYKKRVYIVDNAHFLTQEASNCFLKTLEERNSLFILITNSLEGLLPTIRSRCFVLRFKPLSPSDFKTLGFTDKMLISISDGSMERILKYEKKNIKENIEDIFLWIDELKTSPPFLLINRFLEMDEAFPESLSLLLVLLKKKGFYPLIDEVLKTKEELKANVNKRLALEKMVLGLQTQFFRYII